MYIRFIHKNVTEKKIKIKFLNYKDRLDVSLKFSLLKVTRTHRRVFGVLNASDSVRRDRRGKIEGTWNDTTWVFQAVGKSIFTSWSNGWPSNVVSICQSPSHCHAIDGNFTLSLLRSTVPSWLEKLYLSVGSNLPEKPSKGNHRYGIIFISTFRRFTRCRVV